MKKKIIRKAKQQKSKQPRKTARMAEATLTHSCTF